MYQKMVNARISVHHFYNLNIPKADDFKPSVQHADMKSCC